MLPHPNEALCLGERKTQLLYHKTSKGGISGEARETISIQSTLSGSEGGGDREEQVRTGRAFRGARRRGRCEVGEGLAEGSGPMLGRLFACMDAGHSTLRFPHLILRICHLLRPAYHSGLPDSVSAGSGPTFVFARLLSRTLVPEPVPEPMRIYPCQPLLSLRGTAWKECCAYSQSDVFVSPCREVRSCDMLVISMDYLFSKY